MKTQANLKGLIIGTALGLISWIIICWCLVAVTSAQPFNSPLPTRPPIPTRTSTPSTDNHHSPLPTPTVYSTPMITPLPKFAEVEAPRRVVKRIGGFVR